jgi:hypothetical protein
MLFPHTRSSLLCTVACLLAWMLTGQAQEWQTGEGYRSRAVTVRPSERQRGQTREAVQAWLQEMPGAQTGILSSNGLSPWQIIENGNFMNGSGVAAGDYDGDGLCDLYFCAIVGTNALYRNLGGWRFENVTAASGVGLAQFHSTGAVFADLEGDGDLDLLVSTLGRGVQCFLNEGSGRFRTGTGEAGLVSDTGSTSLALADVDGDGDLDLYVANYGAIPILRSGIRAQMKRVDGQWVVTGPYAKRLRVVNGKLEEQGEPDVLYLNDGRGKFSAVPWNSPAFLDESGQPLPEPWEFGLTVQMRDMNGDGSPDIYVCNDFQSVDRFWVNNGQGKFRALPRVGLRKESYSAMGVDFADIDRDGHLDFFVTEMLSRDHAMQMRQSPTSSPPPPVPGQIENRPGVLRNVLYRNRGDTTYAEIANYSGVTASDWAWQPVFMDVDLDGYEDVLVINGIPLNILDRDILDRIRTLGRQPLEQLRTNILRFPPGLTKNLAYHNRHDLHFQEVGGRWGFDSRRISPGIALADLDNDGDLDIAVNCLNDTPLIYRNETAAGRVLVRLRGRTPNTFGIGAVIRVSSGSLPVQTQEILCGGRYLSGDDTVRTFAASSGQPVTIEVRWRSGKRSVVTGARTDHLYLIEEPDVSQPTPSIAQTAATEKANPAPGPALFQDVSDLLSHQHPEEYFNDYERQPLLPRQLSQLGPGVGWLDLDGDGQDELFLGTGKGGKLGVYRRNAGGRFETVPLAKEWAAPDDTTGLAAWAAADGSRALLAAVAQYEAGDTNRAAVFQCQINAGSRRLSVAEVVETRHLPASAGPLAVADLEGDGDLDLFVGGRLVPGSYPAAANSQIFHQNAGQLSLDTTNSATLQKLGLVSGAVWSDLTEDGLPELILACEWGPLRVFRNDRGILKPWDAPVVLLPALGATNGTSVTLNRLTGWWNGVTVGDFDEDGRLDILASNWGLNDMYQATLVHPVSLHFVDNPTRGTDLIEAYFVAELGADAPRRSLPVMAQSFPGLTAAYPTHESFATATVDQLVRVLRLSPQRVGATTFPTMLFLNRGTNFIALPLAVETQFAPAWSINVGDLDGDGHEDLFLSQNFFATRPEWPRLDGGRGIWLRGDGRGTLTPMSGSDSGIAVYGEQRGAALGDFDLDGRVDLVVSQNGAATRLFKNVAAKPGLRVKLRGPIGNPWGIGARVRLHSGIRAGPVREIHAGSGYWSQDSLVVVMGCDTVADKVEVIWPGGKPCIHPVPPNSLEVEVDASGAIKSTRSR